MICPGCSILLTKLEVSEIELDYCQRCGGIWLDRFELQKLSKTEFTEKLQVNQDNQSTHSTQRKCPKDQYLLMKHFFSKNIRVQIDTCPKCSGIWLDAGEFNLIKDKVIQKNEMQKEEAKHLTDKLYLIDNHIRKYWGYDIRVLHRLIYKLFTKLFG